MANILSKSRNGYLIHTIQTEYNWYNLFANLLKICNNSECDLIVRASNTANRHVA